MAGNSNSKYGLVGGELGEGGWDCEKTSTFYVCSRHNGGSREKSVSNSSI